MKQLLLLFLFVSQLAIGQDKIVYLDDRFREVEKGEHTYYRVVKGYFNDQPQYVVSTYYASGTLQQEGTSSSKTNFKYDGQLISYYSNSQIEEVVTYRDGQKSGPYKSWYENGNKQIEGTFEPYNNTFRLRIMKFWDETKTMTVVDGNGIYSSKGDDYYETVPLTNGLKNGMLAYVNSETGAALSEEYKDGEFVKGVRTNPDGTKTTYDVFEQKPEFEGGNDAFYEFIGKHMKIPRRNKAEGRIVVSFIVSKEGDIEDIKILNSIDKKLDAEAVRALSKSPRWKPAQQRGVPVRCSFQLPIAVKKAPGVD